MLGCPPWLPLSLPPYCEILRKEDSLFIFPVSFHSFSSLGHMEYSLGHLKQLCMFVNKPCRLKFHHETLYSRITGMPIETHRGQLLPCWTCSPWHTAKEGCPVRTGLSSLCLEDRETDRLSVGSIGRHEDLLGCCPLPLLPVVLGVTQMQAFLPASFPVKELA